MGLMVMEEYITFPKTTGLESRHLMTGFKIHNAVMFNGKGFL